MTIGFDPSNDYTMFDGLQSVTYRAKGAATPDVENGVVADTATDYTSIQALKRLVDQDAMIVLFSAGKVQVGDCMWEIPYITGVTPAVGDRVIEADDTEWEVVAIDDKPVLSMWRVLARK